MARQWLHSAVLVAATAALLPLVSAAPNTIHSNSNSSTSLPIVDLGYELQQANAFQPVGNYYNFSNIRFAAPPTGENRFRAPLAPAINRTHVQVGSPRRICAQADPSWETITAEYLPKYLGEGQTQFNASSFPHLQLDCLARAGLRYDGGLFVPGCHGPQGHLRQARPGPRCAGAGVDFWR